MFTYDDFQSGQAKGPYPQPPNHVVSIREQRYKLARYYDVNGKVPDQWEMYDLQTDPLERVNIPTSTTRAPPSSSANIGGCAASSSVSSRRASSR